MGILTPAKKSLFNPFAKKGDEVPITEFPKKKHGKTSSRKWTDAHSRLPSDREIRRIRKRDVDRTTKKHRRQQLQAFAQRKNYGEIASVRVLRHVDDLVGGTGALRLRLIEDGGLSPTRARIVGWEDSGYTNDMDSVTGLSPVTTPVPVGHTPKQILEAAGFGQDAIVELYGYLEAKQVLAAKGPADAALAALQIRLAA